ncbi:hypothetical protein V5O39_17670 [Pseudomonas parakoreensis]
MNRYVLIEPVYQLNFKVVLQVVDAEDFPSLPGGPAYWIDVPQDTIVQAGWLAQFQTFQWVFAEPTYEDYVVLANARMSERFDAAIHWLTFNPLQYKKILAPRLLMMRRHCWLTSNISLLSAK